ncbi:HlyD family efflux transporter periplasmic adaptor subunit [Marinilongibacter aquaticus]|uniref:HlyD family secretion protein n=1 Tax=Marinilongibacter aquaticus TaxID=2975157 RepID=UPI0021BD53D2|nr:HlyD family efflux transporter periplasmic adaptor subunit [Marinilongibacter aquaticus]UBM60893.1 HlyD family efflux transporter periplasmic adaptor subunit [Marinilongibacter aquaticus]
MKNRIKNWSVLIGFCAFSSLIGSCSGDEHAFDASGVFEATETVISAESMGKLLHFDLEEGDRLSVGQAVGQIDCDNLNYQRAQIEASMQALGEKQNSARPQVEILKQQKKSQEASLQAQKEQLKVLEKEEKRFAKLQASDAVPQKQYDDIKGKVEVLQKQITAAESMLAVLDQQVKSAEEQTAIGNRAILSERKPLAEKLAQTENQIGKCQVMNPIAGTVLIKYAEANEVVQMGKPLYKIADLSEMKLRAYITNDQLSQVKLGQNVKVSIDDGKGGFAEYPGTVEWIASQAEFTPKTIQTKEERSNLVYAIKVNVKNEGEIKIGMYGELTFE